MTRNEAITALRRKRGCTREEAAYIFDERIAIKVDAGIGERDAHEQACAEYGLDSLVVV